MTESVDLDQILAVTIAALVYGREDQTVGVAEVANVFPHRARPWLSERLRSATYGNDLPGLHLSRAPRNTARYSVDMVAPNLLVAAQPSAPVAPVADLRVLACILDVGRTYADRIGDAGVAVALGAMCEAAVGYVRATPDGAWNVERDFAELTARIYG